MSGGGSKEEQEHVSIETYSGNVIGEINKDATNKEIQQFIQEVTKNKSHVQLMRTEDAILFGFIDNRHVLLEWDKAKDFGWSLELDVSKLNSWLNKCTFKGTTLIKLNCYYNQLTTLPDLSKCVSLEDFSCYKNQLTELPDLSKCVSLLYLNCSRNKLTILPDLSKCVSLTQLHCALNKLTELPDLSKCVSLTHLNYYDNELIEEPKVPSGQKILILT